MKKKNLNHKGLKLGKSVISNLASENVKGGFTLSCLVDQDTNCGSPGSIVPCPSDTCPPPTDTCPSQFFSCSCPGLGIC